MTKKIKVVDPHIHLWDLETGLYPGLEKPSDSFIGSNAPIARSYLLNEFLSEGANIVDVVAAVHVEAFPTDAIRETQTLQEVADESPIPIAMVGNGDLTSPHFPEQLAAHAEFPIFRGVRQVVNRHANAAYTYADRDLLNDPAFTVALKALGKRGYSFDLQLYPHQMGDAAAIAAQCPDTKIVLNHAGMWIDRNMNGWREWKEGMRSLAAHPNVEVKISGLGMLDKAWSTESIRPLVLETLSIFGVHRSMFASNFPVDKLFSDYATIWSAFSTITEDLTATERALLFRDNAKRVYRL